MQKDKAKEIILEMVGRGEHRSEIICGECAMNGGILNATVHKAARELAERGLIRIKPNGRSYIWELN